VCEREREREFVVTTTLGTWRFDESPPSQISPQARIVFRKIETEGERGLIKRGER